MMTLLASVGELATSTAVRRLAVPVLTSVVESAVLTFLVRLAAHAMAVGRTQPELPASRCRRSGHIAVDHRTPLDQAWASWNRASFECHPSCETGD
jgi:hypothetical protein